ncbi:MAG: hypothetical protein IPP71_10005 [Bacteroidetes bacterium]|nr:hypothetical protein [Bacteroidota bacterium]
MKFNWPDLIKELNFVRSMQYLSDLLFVLSVLGYCKNGGLLPSGIEVIIKSIETVNEMENQSLDKRIYEEFEETKS